MKLNPVAALDGLPVRLWVGDAGRIGAPDACYDAARVHPWNTMFDFRTFRQALTGTGLRVTALRSRPLPGWHQGVAVRD